MTQGDVIALIGAAIAVLMTGMGAARGMRLVQEAAAGMVTEQPHKFGKTLILQLIPSSAALYGFVVGFLILTNTILRDAEEVGYTLMEGLMILAVCLPIGVVGYYVTIAQAKVCTAGVRMIGKREELAGRAITMAVFAELFTLFSLIVAVISLFSIPQGELVGNDGLGNVIAIFGASLAVALTGISSGIGMQWVQETSAHVVADQPQKFGKTLILQLLPSSSALYGFIVGFLILTNTALVSEPTEFYSVNEGLLVLAACLPIAFVGLVANLARSRVCVSGVRMVAKDDELAGRALTMGVLIELFILFALIVSVISVFQIPMSIGG